MKKMKLTLLIAIIAFVSGNALSQLPACVPEPGNCICYGDFESFSNSLELSNGVQGDPIISWDTGPGGAYSVGLSGSVMGFPIPHLIATMQSSADGLSGPNSSVFVLPLSCPLTPCDKAKLTFKSRGAPFTTSLPEPSYYQFRFIKENPLLEADPDLFSMPYVSDPDQYLIVNVLLDGPTTMSDYAIEFINSTMETYEYVLIWPMYIWDDPATSWGTEVAIGDIKLDINSTLEDIPVLPIPDAVCVDNECIDLVSGEPGEFLASGSGVSSYVDVAGDEVWRFCPDAAGAGTHLIEICRSEMGACCLNVNIEVNEGPSPVIGDATFTPCIGSSELICPMIGPDGDSYTYEWLSGETTECITITADSEFPFSTMVTAYNGGCSTTATINIVPDSLPIIELDSTLVFICVGEEVTLSGSSTVDADINWYDGSGELVGIGDEIVITPIGMPETTSLFTASIIDPDSGCTGTANVTVAFNPNPDMSSIDGNVYCLGSSFILPILTTDGAWSGEFVSEGPGGYIFTPLDEGLVELTFTNTFGCSSTAIVSVQGASFEVAEIGNDCSGDCSSFMSLASPGDNYNWTITGPVSAAGSGPNIVFTDLCPGSYFVSATSTVAPYCTGWQTVVIEEETGDWPKTTSNAFTKDEAKDVCNDVNGNIYSIGNFVKGTSFDGLTLDAAPPGVEVMYTSSYDVCGKLRWVALAHLQNVIPEKMTIDDDYGLIYIAGTVQGPATFYSGVKEDGTASCPDALPNYSVVSTGCAFIAVYTTDGCLLHVKEFPSVSGFSMSGEAIATSTYETGMLNHRVYFASRRFNNAETVPDQLRIHAFTPNFVAPYGFSFTSNWTQEVNTTNNAWVNDIETYNGYVSFVGSFQGNLLYPGEPILNGLAGVNDGFVYNIRDMGASPLFLFGRDLLNIASPSRIGNVYSVTMDNNKIVLGGNYRGAISSAFGGPPIPAPLLSSTGGFVTRMSFSGSVNWSHRIGSNVIASVRSLDLDGNDLFIGGEFTGANYYANDVLEGTYVNGKHTFVTKWSTNTGPIVTGWVNASIESPVSSAVPTNRGLTSFNGSVYTCGNYRGLMDHDLTLTTALNSSPLLNQNAYIWRFQYVNGAAKMLETTDTSSIENENSEINIYPNPNDGHFRVELVSDKKADLLIITDILGKEVLQINPELKTNVLSINLSEFADGVYFINLKSAGNWDVKKIIKE